MVFLNNISKSNTAFLTSNNYFAGSQAPALIVIHKSGQARKAVISAWMPKSSVQGWQTVKHNRSPRIHGRETTGWQGQGRNHGWVPPNVWVSRQHSADHIPVSALQIICRMVTVHLAWISASMPI